MSDMLLPKASGCFWRRALLDPKFSASQISTRRTAHCQHLNNHWGFIITLIPVSHMNISQLLQDPASVPCLIALHSIPPSSQSVKQASQSTGGEKQQYFSHTGRTESWQGVITTQLSSEVQNSPETHHTAKVLHVHLEPKSASQPVPNFPAGEMANAVTWSRAMFLEVSTPTPACTSAPFTGGHTQPRLTRHSSSSSTTECPATRDKLSSQLEV